MKKSDIIPFYGGEIPELFEIERRCMDREGKVIEALDQMLPSGKVIDIGAGNGHTAELLTRDDRIVTALEPDKKMIDGQKDLIWAKGSAQNIPFHANMFDAAYATWAFFWEGNPQFEEGLQEVQRVVKQDGLISFVFNYGNDEFSLFAENPKDIACDLSFWTDYGFDYDIIKTAFVFDSVQEARKLMTFFFGEAGERVNKTRISYNVAVYYKKNRK